MHTKIKRKYYISTFVFVQTVHTFGQSGLSWIASSASLRASWKRLSDAYASERLPTNKWSSGAEAKETQKLDIAPICHSEFDK